MNKAWAIIIPLVVLAIVAGLTVLLYWLGDPDQSALEKFRDIMIVYLGLLWVIVVLLLAILVGVLIWVALAVKEKVLPLLDTTRETVSRVKGTAEFMSEEVASPVISFYGTIAKARAMTKTLAGKDSTKKKTGQGGEPGKVAKFLRRESNLD